MDSVTQLVVGLAVKLLSKGYFSQIHIKTNHVPRC